MTADEAAKRLAVQRYANRAIVVFSEVSVIPVDGVRAVGGLRANGTDDSATGPLINPDAVSGLLATGWSAGLLPVGAVFPKQLRITNLGRTTATAMTVAFGGDKPENFSFFGGAFPGIGGTCGTTLDGGKECLIVISCRANDMGTVSDRLTAEYNTGATDEPTVDGASAMDVAVAGNNLAHVVLASGSDPLLSTIDLGTVLPSSQVLVTIDAVARGMRDAVSPAFASNSSLVTLLNNGCFETHIPMNSRCPTTWRISAPVGLGPRNFKIRITYNDGSLAKMAELFFSYTVGTPPVPPPTISFNPLSGLVGSTVTISGSNLANASGVWFNGVPGAITANTATSITTTVPVGATSGKVSATTPGGTAQSVQDFTVELPPPTDPPPSISGFLPASGTVGATVTISGEHLLAATSVTFGAVSATIVSNTDSQIVVTVPATAVTSKIGVITADGSALSGANFTVLPFPPTITGLSVSSGPVGTAVTVTGTHFTGATLRFNTTSAVILTNNGTQVTTTVPVGATTGKVSVTTSGGTGLSAGDFTLTAAPAVLSFAPPSWNAGRVAMNVLTPRAITLMNNGGSPVNDLALAVTGTGFTLVSTNCGSVLNAGATCTVNLGFTPTAVASYTGTLSATSSTLATLNCALSGLGGNPASITANVVNLDFGTVSLRDLATRTVIFTNCATCIAAVLTVGANSSPYTVTSALSATIQPGGSFSGVYRFTPTVAGVHPHTMNASYVPQTGQTAVTIPLTFSGVGDTKGKLVASTGTLAAFPSTIVGNTSAPRTFTLTWYGSDSVPATIVSNNSQFVVGTYPNPIAVNSTVVSVTFAPTSVGAKSGTLTVSPTFSDGSGSAVINVSGTGLAFATLTSNPVALAMGDRTVGGTYSGTVTLTNMGGTAATALSAAFSPPVPGLSVGHACGSTIAVGASCVLTVTFTPVAGLTTGNLVVSFHNGSIATSATTAVSGNGVLRALLALEVPSQSYGKLLLGAIGSKVVTIRNSGSGPATAVTPTVTAPFRVSSHDCGTLAVNATCSATLTFGPSAPPADHSQSFAVAYHNGGNNQSVSLTLTGRGIIREVISAGTNHNCFVNDLGKVKCWGSNSYAQLGTGDLLSRGGLASPALVSVNLGTGRYAIKVASGSSHNCAVLDNHSLKCWGKNDQGQLGLGLPNPYFGSNASELGANLPAVDLGMHSGEPLLALEVSTGFAHTCVLAAPSLDVDGTPDDESLNHRVVKCFGANNGGQLGQGDQIARGASPSDMGNGLPPIAVPGIPMGVAADTSHTLVLVKGGDGAMGVVAFGDNFYGQLGSGVRVGAVNYHPGDVVPLGTGKVPAQVAVGGAVSIVRFTDGTVKAWGLNAFPPDLTGTLGLPWCQNLNQEAVACVGASPSNVVDGYGYQTNAMGNHLPAIPLGASFPVASVSGGGFHSCGVTADGRLKCWGDNAQGQLGQGDSDSRGIEVGQMGDSLPPVSLGADTLISEVATGYVHTCALVVNSVSNLSGVKCWGNNQLGQLGLGDHASRGDDPSHMGDNLPFVSNLAN